MDQLPVPSLTRAREQKINELSTHFANDDLSLEDLEGRMERVYKAANVAELDAITADLKSLAPAAGSNVPAPVRGGTASNLPANYPQESGRLLAIMSSTRRVGRWVVPQNLDVLAVMSDTRIDLTHAILPGGVIDLNVRVVMAAFKLIVPPNVRVVNQVHAFMADVANRADDFSNPDVPATVDTPIIRLNGTAFMAEVKVIVRRREDPVYSDDDDDDED